jgi:hypothetical protein
MHNDRKLNFKPLWKIIKWRDLNFRNREHTELINLNSSTMQLKFTYDIELFDPSL